MKKAIVLTILLAGFAAAESIDLGFENLQHAEVSVVESSTSGMVLDVFVPSIQLTDIARSGVDFTNLNIPGATMSALEPGYPQLPKVSFLAAVPSNPSISITVEEMRLEEIGQLQPYPMQPIPYDNAEEPPFTYEPAAYQGAAYPEETVQYKLDGVLRGVSVGRFSVNPLVWDSDTEMLTVCSYMRVRIDFGGNVDVDPRLYSRFFLPTYRQALLNSDVLGEPQRVSSARTSQPIYASNIREAQEIDAADLLILAGDDFVDTMIQDFVTAKYEQGYMPAVVAAGSWTQTEIEDYIQDAYDNWTVPPSFVLLVGDSPEITAYNSPTGIWSDNRFFCVDGSDYMADIYHGRFCTPTDHYPDLQDKQLTWQFEPTMDSDFWNNLLCAGMLETGGDDTSNRWFLYTCETVHDTYEDIYGKTAERVYITDSSVDPPYYYRNDLPSAGEQIPLEITYDGTTQDIIDCINDGIFLIQHRDHGSISGWADPPFYISDLGDLTNTNDRSPFVFSFNCSTGDFYGTTCFAESMARMEGGASAVVAACASSYSYFNDYIVFGCYMSFNDDYVSPPFSYTEPSGGYLAGQMMMNGKLEMQAAAPFNPYGSWETYAEKEWDLFLVFGDPTMDMRTSLPFELQVEPPYYLGPGATSAAFSVTHPENGPIENALVCMRKESDSLYVTGLTDSDGNVTLMFDPIGDINEIEWTVTAHNALPAEGLINGVGISGEGVTPSAAIGKPFPNPGSFFSFPVTVSQPGAFQLSIYDISGRVVETLHSGELEEGEHSFTWAGTDNGSPSPAGIYIVRINTPAGIECVRRVVLIN